jgi:hypothetical protein
VTSLLNAESREFLMYKVPRKFYVHTFRFVIGSADDFEDVGPLDEEANKPEEERIGNISVYEAEVTSTHSYPEEKDREAARNIGAGKAFYDGWSNDGIITIMDLVLCEDEEERWDRLLK